MLDYEWANPSSVMLAPDEGSESVHGSDPTRHHHHQHNNSILDHYATTQAAFNNLLPPQPQQSANAFAHHFHQAQAHQVHSLFDPNVFASASSYAPTHHHHHGHHPMLSLDPSIPGHQGLMLIPKSEDVGPPSDIASRIGLNLGGRTYFSSEDDFMNRLYRRSRPAEHGSTINSPRCQAEGCHADLSQAKHYHRRHKVCEFHSKASTVVANGLTQRFCQQCSRLSVRQTVHTPRNDANVPGVWQSLAFFPYPEGNCVRMRIISSRFPFSLDGLPRIFAKTSESMFCLKGHNSTPAANQRQTLSLSTAVVAHGKPCCACQ